MDLWCNAKTFLDISCGDWEEHAILLCNYFNYIDARKAEIEQSHKVESFCVLVRRNLEGLKDSCRMLSKG
jgi:hypothetical protein